MFVDVYKPIIRVTNNDAFDHISGERFRQILGSPNDDLSSHGHLLGHDQPSASSRRRIERAISTLAQSAWSVKSQDLTQPINLHGVAPHWGMTGYLPLRGCSSGIPRGGWWASEHLCLTLCPSQSCFRPIPPFITLTLCQSTTGRTTDSLGLRQCPTGSTRRRNSATRTRPSPPGRSDQPFQPLAAPLENPPHILRHGNRIGVRQGSSLVLKEPSARPVTLPLILDDPPEPLRFEERNRNQSWLLLHVNL